MAKYNMEDIAKTYGKLVNHVFNTCTYRGSGFISIIKYNYNGDLLFLGDKDSNLITVIDTVNKRIIGNYEGHNGVIWCLDACKNDLLVSGSGDMYVIFWNLKTGEQIRKVKYKGIPKNVAISNNGEYLLISIDTISKRFPNVLYLYSLSDNTERVLMEPKCKITSMNWLNAQEVLLSYDDGNIDFISIINDTFTSSNYKLHESTINSIAFNSDRTKIISASTDKTSKIFNLEKREVELTIQSTVPLNSACFSPVRNVVMIGGGLDGLSVAFSLNNDTCIKFCSLKKGTHVGEISTHFGPVKNIIFNPNKTNFASAGQDGYVKIYYINNDYAGHIELPDIIPSHDVANIKIRNVCNNQLIAESIKYIEYNFNAPKKNTIVEEKSVGIYKVPTTSMSKTTATTPPTTAPTTTAPTTTTPTPTTAPTPAPTPGVYSIKKVVEKYGSNVVEGCIKISNLPNTITRYDLEEIFDIYGRIKEKGIYIKNYNDDTIAYINYEDIESAKKAVSAMNGSRYEYMIISVELLNK
jgi:translation initiation factor 3 subunit I